MKRLEAYKKAMLAYLVAECDANQALAAARELTSVEQTLFTAPYPPLGSERVVPRYFGAGEWAAATGYRTMDKGGKMTPISGAASDFPEVAIGTDLTLSPVREFGISYGYTRVELLQAAKQGIPLDATKATVAQRAYEELVDEMAWSGDQKLGLKGLKSYLGGDGIKTKSTAAALSTLTNDQILTFLNDLFADVADATNDARSADTLILPTKVRDFLTTRRMGAGDGTLTVLQFFLANSPYCKNVVTWNRLKNGGDNFKGTNQHVALAGNISPQVLRQQIPQAFMVHEPEMQMTRTVVPCSARIGSVELIEPKSWGALQIVAES